MTRSRALSMLSLILVVGASATACGEDDDSQTVAPATGGVAGSDTGGTGGGDTGGSGGGDTGGSGGGDTGGSGGGDTGGTGGGDTGGTAGSGGDVAAGAAGMAGTPGGAGTAGVSGSVAAGAAGMPGTAGGAGTAVGGSAGAGGAAGDGSVAAGAGGMGGSPGGAGTANAGSSGAGGTAAICGNGVTEAGEMCDDGNALACGTCDATCQTAQSSPATGEITASPKNLLNDGSDTFTLNDGVNAVTVFEFDTDQDGCGVGNECIDVSADTSSSDVADSIAAAINAVGATLAITASATGGATVLLTNDANGATGNQAITEDVDAGSFAVVGMAGALGADCLAGDGCNSIDVCASLSCTTNVCD